MQLKARCFLVKLDASMHRTFTEPCFRVLLSKVCITRLHETQLEFQETAIDRLGVTGGSQREGSPYFQLCAIGKDVKPIILVHSIRWFPLFASHQCNNGVFESCERTSNNTVIVLVEYILRTTIPSRCICCP